MSTFYVGQRVRIVQVRQPTEAQVGWEGVVNDLDCVDQEGGGGLIGVTIYGDPTWCFLPHELEPILYDGNQLVSWTECAWRPEGVSA